MYGKLNILSRFILQTGMKIMLFRLLNFDFSRFFCLFTSVFLLIPFFLSSSSLSVFAASWKSGTELKQALTLPAGVTWEEAPIRDSLMNFAEKQRVAIRLDRRVDANLFITGSFQNAVIPVILHETLQSEALSAKKLAFTQLGDLLYVGPREWTLHVRTVAEKKRNEIKKNLSKNAQKKWLVETPVSWERLAEPQQILTSLAEEQGLKIQGLKNVPHDLWPAGSLPPMASVDVCVLILGEFGLTLEFTEDSAAVTALTPEDGVISEIYPKKLAAEKLASVEKLFPETKTVSKAGEIKVYSILEVHEFLKKGPSKGGSCGTAAFLLNPDAAASSGRTPSGVDRSLMRFSGKVVKQMFLPYLKQFAAAQGYTLEMDADALVAAGVTLDAEVTMEFQEATVEEVILKLAAAGGCKAEIRKNTVILTPANP